jgi:predicted nucleic-acid-binding protein
MDDIKEQADAVESILLNNSVLILPEVVAEVVYVLTKYYGQSRDLVVGNILHFLTDASCDSEVLINGLKTFGACNLDFVDCLLYAYSKTSDYTVFTFDKNLKKLIGAQNI